MRQHEDARLQFDGIPRIVHVLAGTLHQALAAQAVIHRAAATIHRKVVPDVRACDSPSAPVRAHLPFGGCAAVLVLDAHALESPVFRVGLDQLLRAFSYRDDLRIFIAADSLENSAHPVLDTLREIVQLTTPMSLDAIEAPLAAYLADLQDAKDAVQWRRFRYPAAIFAGRLAASIQFVAPFVVLVGFIAINAPQLGWLDGREEATRRVMGVSAGVVNFWASTLPLFYLLRGIAAPSIAAVQEPWMLRWFTLGFILSLGFVWLAEAAGVTTSWLVFGSAVGACVDGARRLGLQAQRVRTGLASSSLQPASLVLPRPKRFGYSNPFSCALWPDVGRSVVISYARSSPWGRDVAARLHDSLAKEGALPFLDLKSIPVGSNWRLELQHEIGRASTLICLLDDVAASRAWVAAELHAALEGQVRTGSPHVIVLLHPELRSQSDMPIFRSILDLEAESRSILFPPRIIRFSPYSVDAIAWGLAPTRFQETSVIPPKVARRMEGLLMPITALGALAGPLGLSAWGLWVIEMWKDNPVRGTMGEIAGVVAFLGVAFWFGFAARLTVISRYRVRHDDPKSLAVAHLFTAIGFAALAMAWWSTFTPLVQGWSAVLALAGWWRAGQFVAIANLGGGKGMRPD
jgi:hypothetical protein